MKSIDEAKEILARFQQNHYFINDKAICINMVCYRCLASFIANGLNMDLRKTIDGIK